VKTTITEYRCDRCGYCEGAREGALSHLFRWHRFWLCTHEEGDAPTLEVDLCPACTASFKAWFAQPAAVDRPIAGGDAPASPEASG
jgi:hypothetical protein